MKLRLFAAYACVIASTAGAMAQTSAPEKPVRKSAYLTESPLNFVAIVPPPPVAGSAADKADLAAVHEAQRTRSAAAVAAAKRDDAQEDIFIYATVLGPQFSATHLPLTAALSLHVCGEAGTVTPALKEKWGRPRPFVADSTVHAVCEQKTEPGYPSGHSMVGYLEGLTLAQMVPERAADIMARAREYAANRVVCGVHYPSDTEASRTAALAEFGALSTSPKFWSEVVAARAELRSELGLPPAAPAR